MSITKENYNVGGIAIDVYTLPPNESDAIPSLPVAVLFLLHGRTGSKNQLRRLAEATLKHADTQTTIGKTSSHELVVIALVIRRPTVTCRWNTSLTQRLTYRITGIMVTELLMRSPMRAGTVQEPRTSITLGMGKS